MEKKRRMKKCKEDKTNLVNVFLVGFMLEMGMCLGKVFFSCHGGKKGSCCVSLEAVGGASEGKVGGRGGEFLTGGCVFL